MILRRPVDGYFFERGVNDFSFWGFTGTRIQGAICVACQRLTLRKSRIFRACSGFLNEAAITAFSLVQGIIAAFFRDLSSHTSGGIQCTICIAAQAHPRRQQSPRRAGCIIAQFFRITYLAIIQHTIAATLTFSLYAFLEPFVSHWLGPEYIMDHRILVLLVIYIYITNSRGSVDGFNYAHGLYADVWSAWAELIINVSVTIVCGLQWGIIGILLGKLASLIPIIVIWKPYYLFSSGFKESVSIYWRNIIRNYIISAFAIGTSLYFLHFIPINPYHTLLDWIAYSTAGMIIFLTIDLLTTILFAKGAKDILYRIKNLRKL